MEEITKMFSNILILVLGIGMYLFYNKLKEYFINKYSKISSPSSENISLGIRTQDILQDLMKSYDCNRVLLLEFHNGDVFSSVVPNWKLSLTYELVDSRTIRVTDRLQNIRASLVIDIISGCMSNKFPVGVTNYLTNKECCGNRLIAIDVAEMGNTYAKGIFDFNNSKYLFGCPIRRDNKTVGVIFIDYTENILLDTINKNGCLLCTKANEISTMWELYHKELYKPKTNPIVQFIKRLK